MSDDNYNSEAKALAEQERARHETKYNTPDVEAALRQPDWAKIAPPGTDPQQYMNGMVAKAERSGWYGADARTDPNSFPQPRALTIRSQAGFPRSASQAQPGDVLEFEHNGQTITMEIEHALREGMVARDPSGGYRPVSDQERAAERQQAEQQKQEDQTREDVEMIQKRATGDEPDTEAEAVFKAINSIVPAPAVQAMVKDFADNGSLSSENVLRIARSVGLSEDAAFTFTEHAVAGVRRQSDTAIATKGVPSEEADAMYAWAEVQHPLDHKNAMLSLALASDAAPMKALAVKYRAWKRERSQQ